MSRRPRRRTTVAATVLACASLLPLGARAGTPPPRTWPLGHHPEQGSEGHLPPSRRAVELVGSLHLTDVPWGIGDVAGRGNFAYVAAYRSECNRGIGPGGGVHVVDLSIPQLPRKVGFVSAGRNTYVGEGVQVLPIRTSRFRGDLLVMSNEPCSFQGRANGGISLWDVTDPVYPEPLAIGVGDRSPRPYGGLSAHSSHSAMAWQAGSKAYAVLVDNEDALDVDIMDITDPRRPKLIAETGLARWPAAITSQSTIGLFPASFHHDMWVRRIGGHWYLLLSYWDTGWVLVNVDDPRRPRYVRSSEYPVPDPLTRGTPEGNAHQAVWTSDDRYIVGAGEDFFAKRTSFTARRGRSVRGVAGHELYWGAPIASRFRVLNGQTIYGGLGCPPLEIPRASSLGQRARGEEATVVLLEGACSFADKVRAAEAAGYDAVLLASSHVTASFGASPTRIACHEPSGGLRPRASVLCISHLEFHTLLGTAPNYGSPVQGEPSVGRTGAEVEVSTFFDRAWGDVRLLDARTLRQVDVYAIPQARASGYGDGYGILSVHEVEADPRRGVPLVYSAWYSGGLRVLQVDRARIREVGHFVDGNTFWGIHPLPRAKGGPLLLLSDVNHGLWILRYTGPQ